MSSTLVDKVFTLGAETEARMVLFVLAYHADLAGRVNIPPWKIAEAAGLDMEATEGQLSALDRLGVYSRAEGRLRLDRFPQSPRVRFFVYTVVHVDTGQSVEAFFPDFPGVTIKGDRLADTITLAPATLQRHVDEMMRDGRTPPEAEAINLWELYQSRPQALVGFVRVMVRKGGAD